MTERSRFLWTPADPFSHGVAMGLTVNEAAERLRVSTWTVRNYLAAGRLRGVKYTAKGRWWIDPSSIDELARGEAA